MMAQGSGQVVAGSYTPMAECCLITSAWWNKATASWNEAYYFL